MCSLMDAVLFKLIINFVGLPIDHIYPDLDTISLFRAFQFDSRSFLVFQWFCLGLSICPGNFCRYFFHMDLSHASLVNHLNITQIIFYAYINRNLVGTGNYVSWYSGQNNPG